MTPKEKAKELIEKYSIGYPIVCRMNNRNMYLNEAVHCALIAVDETLNACNRFDMPFWEQVKTELENL